MSILWQWFCVMSVLFKLTCQYILCPELALRHTQHSHVIQLEFAFPGWSLHIHDFIYTYAPLPLLKRLNHVVYWSVEIWRCFDLEHIVWWTYTCDLPKIMNPFKLLHTLPWTLHSQKAICFSRTIYTDKPVELTQTFKQSSCFPTCWKNQGHSILIAQDRQCHEREAKGFKSRGRRWPLCLKDMKSGLKLCVSRPLQTLIDDVPILKSFLYPEHLLLGKKGLLGISASRRNFIWGQFLCHIFVFKSWCSIWLKRVAIEHIIISMQAGQYMLFHLWRLRLSAGYVLSVPRTSVQAKICMLKGGSHKLAGSPLRMERIDRLQCPG